MRPIAKRPAATSTTVQKHCRPSPPTACQPLSWPKYSRAGMSISPASGCSSNAVCQPSGSRASGSRLPENTMTTGVATALMPRSFSAAVAATLSSITIEADNSSASSVDSTKASPAAAFAGSCHAHSFKPASGNATAAKAAISATRGSTRAAIQPALRANHSA